MSAFAPWQYFVEYVVTDTVHARRCTTDHTGSWSRNTTNVYSEGDTVDAKWNINAEWLATECLNNIYMSYVVLNASGAY